MKKLLLILLSTFTLASNAEVKDVFRKVPKRFDIVMRLDVKQLLQVEKLKEKLIENKAFQEIKEKLAEKTGLSEKDLLSITFCANSKQYYNIKDFRDINFDSLMMIELAKPLDLEAVIKELPSNAAKIKEVHGIKCISIENKQMRNPQAAFITPKLIAICPQYCLEEVLTVSDETCIFQNKMIIEMLKENGFGGLFSVVHAGQLQKVPSLTPWLKQYIGGSFNMYYEESNGIDIEFTTTYDSVQAVKSASLMIGMGMNFLEMKPELKQFKELIKFRVHERSLLVDFNISQEMILKFEKMTLGRIESAKKRALVGRSISNAKQLSVALNLYAKDHGQKLPVSIDELKEYLGENYETLVVCPVTEQRYTYLRNVDKLDDSEEPGKVEVFKSEMEFGTVVAYLDGHTKFIRRGRR